MNSQPNKPLLIICTIAAIAGVWLFNPLPLYFLNDDFIHIPLSKDGVWFQRNSFRPICDLSIAIDYWLWKKQAWGYHFTNVLLHVLNSILVYMLAKQLSKKYSTTYSTNLPLLAAILFFIYPFHSESIYWILGRSGSLGALWFILSITFYIRRYEKSLHIITSCLFFLLGVLTYESVWIFPLIALIISWKDCIRQRFTFAREFRFLVPVILLFVVMLVVRYWIVGQVAGVYEAEAFRGLDIKQLGTNLIRLITRSFAPPVDTATGVVVSAVIVITSLLVSIIMLRKNKLTLFLTGLFVSWLPYLSLGIDTHGVEGERYLYLPSVFTCLLFANILTNSIRRSAVQVIIASLLICYFIFYLNNSKKQYTIASNITRTTMDAVSQSKSNFITVDSLPQEVNGALVFRLGFKEGVQWFNPSTKNIDIRSVKQEKSHWSAAYLLVGNSAASTGCLLFTDSALLVR